MKYLKILGLAAIAAAALMAFAGTASATELTCGAEMCPTGTEIKSVSEGHATLDAPFGTIQCNSAVSGKTSNTGGAETVEGSISTLDFTNCTNATVDVLKNGTLEIHTAGSTANGNGTLTSTGAEVTVEYLGTHCIFTTKETDLGTVTGSANTANGRATLDISARIPRTSGRSGVFCGESAPWTGSYEVTAPTTLNVD